MLRHCWSCITRLQTKSMSQGMQSGKVTLCVHDVIVKDNMKMKDQLIKAELETIRNATLMLEIIQAASTANYRLWELSFFNFINITLDVGSPKLPRTTNVIVQVEELKSPVSGQISIFTKCKVHVSLYLYSKWIYIVCYVSY